MAEVGRGVYAAIAVILLGLTVKDIFSTSQEGGRPQKEIPESKLTRYAGPTLQFSFWYGYRKVYEQYADVVRQKYPDLILEGEHYPPPSYRMHLAQFLGIAKIILIIMIVSSFDPFSACGVNCPSFYNWFIQNKLYACMMIYFLSNAIEGQLISTGAFEISFNGMPVWSKLETGRLPSPAELFQIIDNNLQFNH